MKHLLLFLVFVIFSFLVSNVFSLDISRDSDKLGNSTGFIDSNEDKKEESGTIDVELPNDSSAVDKTDGLPLLVDEPIPAENPNHVDKTDIHAEETTDHRTTTPNQESDGHIGIGEVATESILNSQELLSENFIEGEQPDLSRKSRIRGHREDDDTKSDHKLLEKFIGIFGKVSKDVSDNSESPLSEPEIFTFPDVSVEFQSDSPTNDASCECTEEQYIGGSMTCNLLDPIKDNIDRIDKAIALTEPLLTRCRVSGSASGFDMFSSLGESTILKGSKEEYCLELEASTLEYQRLRSEIIQRRSVLATRRRVGRSMAVPYTTSNDWSGENFPSWWISYPLSRQPVVLGGMNTLSMRVSTRLLDALALALQSRWKLTNNAKFDAAFAAWKSKYDVNDTEVVKNRPEIPVKKVTPSLSEFYPEAEDILYSSLHSTCKKHVGNITQIGSDQFECETSLTELVNLVSKYSVSSDSINLTSHIPFSESTLASIFGSAIQYPGFFTADLLKQLPEVAFNHIADHRTPLGATLDAAMRSREEALLISTATKFGQTQSSFSIIRVDDGPELSRNDDSSRESLFSDPSKPSAVNDYTIRMVASNAAETMHARTDMSKVLIQPVRGQVVVRMIDLRSDFSLLYPNSALEARDWTALWDTPGLAFREEGLSDSYSIFKKMQLENDPDAVAAEEKRKLHEEIMNASKVTDTSQSHSHAALGSTLRELLEAVEFSSLPPGAERHLLAERLRKSAIPASVDSSISYGDLLGNPSERVKTKIEVSEEPEVDVDRMAHYTGEALEHGEYSARLQRARITLTFPSDLWINTGRRCQCGSRSSPTSSESSELSNAEDADIFNNCVFPPELVLAALVDVHEAVVSADEALLVPAGFAYSVKPLPVPSSHSHTDSDSMSNDRAGELEYSAAELAALRKVKALRRRQHARRIQQKVPVSPLDSAEFAESAEVARSWLTSLIPEFAEIEEFAELSLSSLRSLAVELSEMSRNSAFSAIFEGTPKRAFLDKLQSRRLRRGKSQSEPQLTSSSKKKKQEEEQPTISPSKRHSNGFGAFVVTPLLDATSLSESVSQLSSSPLVVRDPSVAVLKKLLEIGWSEKRFTGAQLARAPNITFSAHSAAASAANAFLNRIFNESDPEPEYSAPEIPQVSSETEVPVGTSTSYAVPAEIPAPVHPSTLTPRLSETAAQFRRRVRKATDAYNEWILAGGSQFQTSSSAKPQQDRSSSQTSSSTSSSSKSTESTSDFKRQKNRQSRMEEVRMTNAWRDAQNSAFSLDPPPPIPHVSSRAHGTAAHLRLDLTDARVLQQQLQYLLDAQRGVSKGMSKDSKHGSARDLRGPSVHFPSNLFGSASPAADGLSASPVLMLEWLATPIPLDSLLHDPNAFPLLASGDLVERNLRTQLARLRNPSAWSSYEEDLSSNDSSEDESSSHFNSYHNTSEAEIPVLERASNMVISHFAVAGPGRALRGGRLLAHEAVSAPLQRARAESRLASLLQTGPVLRLKLDGSADLSTVVRGAGRIAQQRSVVCRDLFTNEIVSSTESSLSESNSTDSETNGERTSSSSGVDQGWRTPNTYCVVELDAGARRLTPEEALRARARADASILGYARYISLTALQHAHSHVRSLSGVDFQAQDEWSDVDSAIGLHTGDLFATSTRGSSYHVHLDTFSNGDEASGSAARSLRAGSRYAAKKSLESSMRIVADVDTAQLLSAPPAEFLKFFTEYLRPATELWKDIEEELFSPSEEELSASAKGSTNYKKPDAGRRLHVNPVVIGARTLLAGNQSTLNRDSTFASTSVPSVLQGREHLVEFMPGTFSSIYHQFSPLLAQTNATTVQNAPSATPIRRYFLRSSANELEKRIRIEEAATRARNAARILRERQRSGKRALSDRELAQAAETAGSIATQQMEELGQFLSLLGSEFSKEAHSGYAGSLLAPVSAIGGSSNLATSHEDGVALLDPNAAAISVHLPPLLPSHVYRFRLAVAADLNVSSLMNAAHSQKAEEESFDAAFEKHFANHLRPRYLRQLTSYSSYSTPIATPPLTAPDAPAGVPLVSSPYPNAVEIVFGFQASDDAENTHSHGMSASLHLPASVSLNGLAILGVLVVREDSDIAPNVWRHPVLLPVKAASPSADGSSILVPIDRGLVRGLPSNSRFRFRTAVVTSLGVSSFSVPSAHVSTQSLPSMHTRRPARAFASTPDEEAESSSKQKGTKIHFDETNSEGYLTSASIGSRGRIERHYHLGIKEQTSDAELRSRMNRSPRYRVNASDLEHVSIAHVHGFSGFDPLSPAFAGLSLFEQLTQLMELRTASAIVFAHLQLCSPDSFLPLNATNSSASAGVEELARRLGGRRLPDFDRTDEAFMVAAVLLDRAGLGDDAVPPSLESVIAMPYLLSRQLSRAEPEPVKRGVGDSSLSKEEEAEISRVQKQRQQEFSVAGEAVRMLSDPRYLANVATATRHQRGSKAAMEELYARNRIQRSTSSDSAALDFELDPVGAAATMYAVGLCFGRRMALVTPVDGGIRGKMDSVRLIFPPGFDVLPDGLQRPINTAPSSSGSSTSFESDYSSSSHAHHKLSPSELLDPQFFAQHFATTNTLLSGVGGEAFLQRERARQALFADYLRTVQQDAWTPGAPVPGGFGGIGPDADPAAWEEQLLVLFDRTINRNNSEVDVTSVTMLPAHLSRVPSVYARLAALDPATFPARAARATITGNLPRLLDKVRRAFADIYRAKLRLDANTRVLDRDVIAGGLAGSIDSETDAELLALLKEIDDSDDSPYNMDSVFQEFQDSLAGHSKPRNEEGDESAEKEGLQEDNDSRVDDAAARLVRFLLSADGSLPPTTSTGADSTYSSRSIGLGGLVCSQLQGDSLRFDRQGNMFKPAHLAGHSEGKGIGSEHVVGVGALGAFSSASARRTQESPEGVDETPIECRDVRAERRAAVLQAEDISFSLALSASRNNVTLARRAQESAGIRARSRARLLATVASRARRMQSGASVDSFALAPLLRVSRQSAFSNGRASLTILSDFADSLHAQKARRLSARAHGSQPPYHGILNATQLKELNLLDAEAVLDLPLPAWGSAYWPLHPSSVVASAVMAVNISFIPGKKSHDFDEAQSLLALAPLCASTLRASSPGGQRGAAQNPALGSESAQAALHSNDVAPYAHPLVKGRIVVVERSSRLPLGMRARCAASLGAAALVIVDDEKQRCGAWNSTKFTQTCVLGSTEDSGFSNNDPEASWAGGRIPTVLVTRDVGEAIVNAFKNFDNN